MTFRRTGIAVLVCVVGCGLPLFAQSEGGRSDRTERGTVEAGAYSGITFGLQGALAVVCSSTGCVSQDSGNTHPNIGGQFGVAAASWLWILSDIGYTPLGSASATSRGQTSNISGSAMNFHGALEFQPKAIRKIVPFGSVGWGAFRQTTSGSLLGSDANLSGNFFSGQVGGGARIYMSRRWGLKLGVYGVSAKIADTGSIENDYGRFGMFKAGVFFHSR